MSRHEVTPEKAEELALLLARIERSQATPLGVEVRAAADDRAAERDAVAAARKARRAAA